ncbi:hypothetical protein O181_020463 [Austropuccinia psidii MF-1]|uniref:Uncharacterized protein n=1 Tax=Austropuccinia psidii MF-1 TaxID=1389203 RepID=A0A9Q3CCZ4_9BASI|nr:hypothetical protein [Austropuccinia psidii MF-1]
MRERSYESIISGSSIEIQTSPAPRGFITKEPFRGPEEVEVTTSSNQMDLDWDLQAINPKDQIVRTEERHKWRIAELPQVPKVNSGNIPVSVQELVYGGKTAGVQTSFKPLDKENELLSSSKEALVPRKDRGPSEGLETHFSQRTSTKDESFVEKPKHFVGGPEEIVGPKEGKQPSGSSSSFQKRESTSNSAKKGQESPKEQ